MNAISPTDKKMNQVDYQSLIINNPENQGLWKRVGFLLLTLFFWGLWFYLWTPLPELLRKLMTQDLSEISFKPATYILVFISLFFVLALWQIIWLNFNLRRFKNKGRRSNKRVLKNDELGGFFTVDNKDLDNWQQSKCLVIMHDKTGEIQEVDVNEFFSFAPSLPKKEDEQSYQRHYVVLLPRKQNRPLFRHIRVDFPVIMKVLCHVFSLRYVDCKMAKKYLTLIVDIPTDYNAGKVIKQVKSASASIIEKKYANDLITQAKDSGFWRSEQLIKVSKLSAHDFWDFFKNISQRQSNDEFNKDNESVDQLTTGQQKFDRKTGFWQDGTRLVIENEETGLTSQLDINDFFVCVPLPSQNKNMELARERIYVVLLPNGEFHSLFDEIGCHFRVIMNVLCTLFYVSLVDCIVAKSYVTLALDLPNNYNPDVYIKQLKKASALIIGIKYAGTDNKAQFAHFWRNNTLITTTENVDYLLKNFIQENQ